MSDKNKNIHLLVIDPQNDFCDIPPSMQPENPLLQDTRIAPALAVPGAHSDMLRLAQFIDRASNKLTNIHVTLDSHGPLDIAHPTWWCDANGEMPLPFTLISETDIRNGIWRARNPLMQTRSLQYAIALAANSRHVLVIWPEHCLIGQWGHNIHSSVAYALNSWTRHKMAAVDYVIKGTNVFTEHYSAIQAEVPDPSDPTTTLNSVLIGALAKADNVIIAGEALSHCLASTVRDIVDNFGEEHIKKLVLLTDCTSSVSGFELLGTQFVAEMRFRGMQTALSTEYLAE
jgi:nicotinamidase/pyrazinamidase